MTSATDTKQSRQPALANISELLAYALALEQEATERYAELAQLMATHNNHEVAELFVKMARIEQLHVDEIRGRIKRNQITDLPVAHFRWVGLTGPEATDPADLHYLMTPHQAITLALLNEQRAHAFYHDIAVRTRSQEIREFAEELAHEEEEHVALVKTWLDRFPETDAGWDEDDDPPNLQD
jgi:rubrerythrin